MSCADWKLKPPSAYKGAVIASIVAKDSRFKLKTHSKYGLSCFNGDEEKGTIDLELDTQDFQKLQEVESWVRQEVFESPFSDHKKGKDFHSSFKDETLKAKVLLGKVCVWSPDGSKLSTDDLYGRDLSLEVVVQPKRVYFMGKLYGIVWEATDILAHPKEVVCPFI